MDTMAAIPNEETNMSFEDDDSKHFNSDDGEMEADVTPDEEEFAKMAESSQEGRVRHDEYNNDTEDDTNITTNREATDKEVTEDNNDEQTEGSNNDEEHETDSESEGGDSYDLNAIMAKRNRYSSKNLEKARAKAAKAVASAVSTSKPKDPKQKAFRFGILFTRVESGSKVSILPSKLREIITAITAVDDEAIILPHNNSENKAMPIQEFIANKGMDYKTYFDSQVVRWGHAREDKWRLAFSFYLASDTIEPNLKQMRNSMELVTCLKNIGLSMVPHTLHESRDEALGFLLGKSQQFTWIDDIKDRLRNHLKVYLNRSPEISIKPRTVTCEEISAEVLSIFVGHQDFPSIRETLVKHPFLEVDIIMHSLKYEGKDSYKCQLQIHNAIQESSKAIKLCNITESQIVALRAKCENDPEAKMRILDFAKYKNSDANKVVYVQFHETHKEWVTKWLKTHIGKSSPDNPYIEDRDTGSKQTARTQKSQKTQITYQSRFQYMWNSNLFELKDSTSSKISRRRGGIPPAIAVENRSYASAARNANTSQGEQSSRSSSPDRSMDSSLKTRREIELEEKVDELWKQNQSLQISNQKLQVSNQELQISNQELKISNKNFEEQNNIIKKTNQELQKELENVKDTVEEMKADQEYALDQYKQDIADLKQMFNTHIRLQDEKQQSRQSHRRSLSPKERRKRMALETPEKMKRELKNLKSRQGDIWYEHDETMEAFEASRPTSPAEAAPDPGGASANSK